MKKLCYFLSLLFVIFPATSENIPGLPPISDQELNELIKMIESLPPDVRDELTKTGEEIIKRADSLGRDPFELIAEAAEKGQDVFGYTDELVGKSSAVLPNQEPTFDTTAEPTKPTISERTINSLKDLLQNTIDALNSFNEKITGDAAKRNAARAYEYVINDMIFYLEMLNTPHLLAYLEQPEFAALKAHIEKFNKELTHLEASFIIEEYTLEGINPYKILNLTPGASERAIVQAYQRQLDELKHEKRTAAPSMIDDIEARISDVTNAYSAIRNLKEAEFFFNNILSAIAHAADSLMIIEDIKKLITRYEPEALATKKAQESLEAQARKEQAESRRIAPTPYIPSFDMPRHQKSSLGEDYFGGLGDYKSPFDYEPSSGAFGGSESTPAFDRGVKGKEGGAPRKDDKKAPEKKKDDAKRKEEGKKEDKKEAAKKEETPRSVGESVAIIKDKVKELEKNLEKTISDKKDFVQAISNPEWITQPFNAEFAKTYSDFIGALRQQLEGIDKKIEIAFDKALKTPAEKAAYTKEVAKIWADFEKTEPYTKLGKLLFTIGLSTTPQLDIALQPGKTVSITPEYRYLVWGEGLDKVAPLNTPPAPLAPGAQPTTKQIIVGINPLKDVVDAQGKTVKQGTNRIKELHDLYKKVKEAKEPKKKPNDTKQRPIK